MEVLKFKKLHDDAILPTRKHGDDAGLDIYALEDIEIPPTELSDDLVRANVGRTRARTGIAVEIQPTQYGKVVGRSGMAFNSDIVVFEGTIDSSYRGEMGVLLYNFSEHPYFIAKGDRIAQLIVMECKLPEPVWTDELSDGVRGADGFGSSGK